MRNHLNTSQVGRANLMEIPPLTVLPNSLMSIGELALTATWMAVRDSLATIGACAVGFGATVGAREICQRLPGAHHAFAALDVVSGGATAFVFGAGASVERWRPTRVWIGGAAAVVCVALTLAALYCDADANAQKGVATSYFGTVVYSLTRELLQNQSNRLFPEVRLDPRRALRWDGGRDTQKHLARLGIGMVTYATTSIVLSRWVTLRGILSSNFSAMDQELGLFSMESWFVFALRGANEGLDAAIGFVLLAVFFREGLRRGRGWASNHTDPLKTVLPRAGSRISTNLAVNAIQSLIPDKGWYLPALQGPTAARGALLNLKQGRWQPADGHLTRGDGNCLLHAAGGEINHGEWVCADPWALRADLCEEIRRLADSEDDNRVAQGRAFVEHHLQQAVAHLNAQAHVPGFEPVQDGSRLLRTLPVGLQTALGPCTTHDQRVRVAGQWLADDTQRGALLDGVAAFYAGDDTYLPTLVLPCLARTLQQPLALHVGDTDLMYDADGNVVDQPAEGTVHIRHTVSHRGETGDHFERVQASTARREDGWEDEDTLNQAMRRDTLGATFDQEMSITAPLNGNRQSAGPRDRTPTHVQAPVIEFPTEEESKKKN
ncbi:MAG: hypothetical protein KAF64_11950 [Hydrogenophaga sp.]|uniref:hypothetical protein n=1 Tax=Hydrogenophaga sp. TaxID=1904254 RepID=UPI0025C0A425|nr:hypothetical protein [Hydrogenophaga sp.]MBU7574061.1 hypothetical protein [Hydrogenophaga sp.]